MRVLGMRLAAGVFALATMVAACDAGLTTGFSQFGTNGTNTSAGTIQGRVTTPTGGLGGVGVVLVGRDSTQTDGTGTYRFSTVPSGTYNVSVRVPTGYALGVGQTGTQSVTVGNGGTATANFSVQQTTASP